MATGYTRFQNEADTVPEPIDQPADPPPGQSYAPLTPITSLALKEFTDSPPGQGPTTPPTTDDATKIPITCLPLEQGYAPPPSTTPAHVVAVADSTQPTTTVDDAIATPSTRTLQEQGYTPPASMYMIVDPITHPQPGGSYAQPTPHTPPVYMTADPITRPPRGLGSAQSPPYTTPAGDSEAPANLQDRTRRLPSSRTRVETETINNPRCAAFFAVWFCTPLGIVALIFSCMVDWRLAKGDIEGARCASLAAVTLALCSYVFGVVGALVAVVLNTL